MQRKRFKTEAKTGPSGRWAIGRVHLGVLQPEAQLAKSHPVTAVFHGDLFNHAELLNLLDDSQQEVGAAALVGALYQKFGTGCISRLKGSFCCALFDEASGRLVLASDRMGSYPLYWKHMGQRFVFASEIRALRADAPLALNAEAVNDLLHFGFPIGDKTLGAGVRTLPPATVLTYDSTTNAVALERYASWMAAFHTRSIERPQYLDELAAAFTTSMQRSTAGVHKYGLSLSGGLDTRVLLSALDDMRVPLATFTLGGKGCADEVIGYQLARVFGSRHRFIPLEEEYLATLLPMIERMVFLTDGMYTSHGFTEVLALQAFEQTDCTVLLRGHAGELAKTNTAWPFHTDPAVFEMKTSEELLRHLSVRFEAQNHPSAAAGLFKPAWSLAADMRLAQASLKEAVDIELSPPDLCSYLYLHEFHRRVTVPSMEIFREVVEVRLPLADVDFIELLFHAPSRWREGVSIHQSLIARGRREYLRIRNPNTGASAGAGPLQEFVLDKVNTVLRRLNVHGYRHYHAFDGWMRRSFLEIAARVLTESQSLDRGILDGRTIRLLLERAQKGDDAPDHVLQVLLLVELWLRQQGD